MEIEVVGNSIENNLQFENVNREEEEGEVEEGNDVEEGIEIPLNQTQLITRCHFVDFLRGIAIIVMLQANIIPYINHLPSPLYLRLLYSLAAPIFIFLSGYSATKFSSSNRNVLITSFPFSVQRVLCSAIFVDTFAWVLYPFQTFDVLYIISLVILTLHHFNHTDIYWIIFSFCFIFLIWIILYFIAAYRFHVLTLFISQTIPILTYVESCVRHFLFDGWFPFFPWILVGWFGSFHVRLSSYNTIYVRVLFCLLSIFLTIIYLVPSNSPLYVPSSTPNEPREDYEEIFYPVTPLYFFWCCSTVSTLLNIFELCEPFIEKYQQYNPICLLGRNSLFVYILHCLYISYAVILVDFPYYTLQENWFNYLILYLFVTILSYTREYCVPNVRSLPVWVRLMTGI